MKTRTMKTIINLFVSLVMIATASCQEARSVKVTVTEEDGTSVEGAKVDIRYLGQGTRKEETKSGLTDAHGVFVSQGTADLRILIFLEKEGYYTSRSGRLSRKQDHDVTFVLRKIKNPIPLYARKFRGKLPGIGNNYGFDFKIGDWVAPHGKGKRADLFFRAIITEDKTSKLAGQIEITFPHEEEGAAVVTKKNGYLPLSVLAIPNNAFKEGYIEKVSRVEAGYENKGKEPNESYFFRTRVKKSKTGEFIFNYSKLKESFNFRMGGGRFLEEPYRSKYPQEYGAVEFTYYFNPAPNDRNLEFDLDRNLFEDLDSTERVNEP